MPRHRAGRWNDEHDPRWHGSRVSCARSRGSADVGKAAGKPDRIWGSEVKSSVALGAVIALIASACTGQAPPDRYDAAGTTTCLKSRHDFVATLPTATPPTRQALYVYRQKPEYFVSSATAQLLAWYGPGQAAELQEASLLFFPRELNARTYYESDDHSQGARQVRNVIIYSDETGRRLPGRLRSILLDCLRTRRQAGDRRLAPRPLPAANLATFEGDWGGHTRGLAIERSGQGSERVNDGCCTPVFNFSFQLLRASGTVKHATATFRVTAVKLGRGLRVGQLGRLVLKDGIVTDTLSGAYFCSNPAWGATRACGA
jgi:hypothetical protein